MSRASFTSGNDPEAGLALEATSSLRRALLAPGDHAIVNAALQSLPREAEHEASATWARLTSHLVRAYTLLADQATAANLLGSDVDALPSAIEDLLWQAECLLLQPGVATSVEAWEQHWVHGLPASLVAWLQADDDLFIASLEQALQPVVPAPAKRTASEAENELVQAFLEEMDEGLDKAEQLLLALEQEPGQSSLLHALFRQYHTLKGAAAAVDLHDAAAQLHEGESLLQALRDGEVELPTSNVVDFFLRLGDSVRAIVDEACGRKVTTEKIADLDGAIAGLLRDDSSASDGPATTVHWEGNRNPGNGLPTLPTAAAAPAPSDRVEFPQLQTLRAKAERGELDPELLAVIEALERRAEFFSTMAASLQFEVQQLRTVALEEVFRRLGRPVREAARLEGKQVRLEIAGGNLRIAKNWAEPLAAALLHLVRNSVAHGIESPGERVRLGKPAEGRVRVEAFMDEGGNLSVTVSDDGRGLDHEAIRNKARALGWLDEKSPACTEAVLLSFLFRPGFSTRTQANELAGRGVGMDVVATEVRQLGGEVSLRSTPGAGTMVTLTLPAHIRKNSV